MPWRLPAALAAALVALLAGCAAAPPAQSPGVQAADHGAWQSAEVPRLDMAGKRSTPRLVKKRPMAIPNARYHLETEADETGPASAERILRAHAQRDALAREVGRDQTVKSAGVQPSQWQSLGPGNVAGRIRSIAFDPRNARRLFVGAASGGLWLSEDAGATWRNNNDFLPNLSITTIVVDPRSPDVMYIGTGEVSQGLVGVGVFKSTDGGTHWRFLANTSVDRNPDWRFVNRLAIHPQQTSILLAGVSNTNSAVGGIYRSIDGGESWTKVASMKALDLAFEPANPMNVVAGLDDGTVGYSRDAGLSWQRSAPLVTDGSRSRIEVAFARSQPGVVYASVDHAQGEVWKSTDSGATWEIKATLGHLKAQGDYDNAIWVDPFDANHVLTGGLDLHRSTDGGVTFDTISDWTQSPFSPHADQHAIVSPPDYGPSNPAIFVGNDGGVYRTPNVRTFSPAWSAMNEGLNVTQFYSGAGRTAAGGRILGGTQDNKSLVLAGGQWRFWGGGDGGFVAVDPASDQTLYGELYYLAIYRSTTGGASFGQYICNGIADAYKPESGTGPCGNTTQKANFIAPFVLDPNNPARMLAGGNSLWATNNLRLPTAPSWTAIKPPSPTPDNFINAITVAEGDGNQVWVGHNNGELYRSGDALSPAPSWTRIGQGILPLRRVMRVLVDRDNAARVIVAFTGFVPNNLWQTLDGGATWSSITGNLPDAPIFDVKRHPRKPQWLYVATSVGVFTSEDGGASWSTTNEGPANIRVRELFWIDDATLGAATFGRGMWKVAVESGADNYQDLWWAGQQENGWGMSLTQHGSTLFGALFVYDAQGRPVWYVLPGGSWNAGFTTYSGALYAPTGSWFGNYDASRINVGAPVGNASITFTGRNAAILSYTIGGTSATKSIQRQLFGPADATPAASYGDLWWGGTAQNGWGVAISQQYRTLFAVWYTYDQNGRTVWYVVPGGEWLSANSYRGAAYRTTGPAWLGVPYNASAFATQPAGSVTFTFTDINTGVMSYTIDGVTQAKPITRQGF